MALITLREYAKMHGISMMNIAERAKFTPMRCDPVRQSGLELYEYTDVVSWHKRVVDKRKFLN